MERGLFLAPGGAAISVGALHTLAPDHWLPFAALARAQGWSAGRTARITRPRRVEDDRVVVSADPCVAAGGLIAATGVVVMALGI